MVKSKNKGVEMYTISKKIEIAGAHRLNLPYGSPCIRLHGHNWIIEVEVSCETLTESGMVIDFKYLKEAMINVIKKPLDHQNLNDVSELRGLNPTAENLAKWIAEKMQKYLIGQRPIFLAVSKVSVQESEGNVACYIP